MTRQVIATPRFTRAAKRFLRKHPEYTDRVRDIAAQLASDAFAPSLGTHALKGTLKGLWSCSGGYDVRVLFEFDKHGDGEVILLSTIGTHDEVY